MLTYKFLLCAVFLQMFTSPGLMLSPDEELRLKQQIDLIFAVPNMTQVPLQDVYNLTNKLLVNMTISSKSEILNITSEKDTSKCKCECNNGIDIRTQADPCYNFMKCCEAEKNITFPNPKTVGCGIRNRFGVGARTQSEEALFGEFPWTVAVLCDTGVDEHNKTLLSLQCGGSVIHPQVILTAAHCVVKPFKQYYIRAGEWDTRETLELLPHQDRQVREILIHSLFDITYLINDVALLILREPLILAENIQPVCLPEQAEVVEHGKRCYATGFGVDAFEMKNQAILKKVEVPIVERDVCEELLRNTVLGKSFVLGGNFICAGGEPKRDTCQGDGGSPLVCRMPSRSKRYYQYGMVSWGVGCGNSNVPGIYVNVALYRNWIDYHMYHNNFEASYYTYTSH